MNKNILLLGSSGLIGSRFYSYLKKKNINVVGISRSESKTTTCVYDFMSDNCKKIQEFYDQADLIINLISIAHKSDSHEDLIKQNIMTLENTLNYDFDPKKYVYFSSEDAISADELPAIDHEELKSAPFWLQYGVSKGACEKICSSKNVKIIKLPPFLEPGTHDFTKRAFSIKPLGLKFIVKPDIYFNYVNSEILFKKLSEIDTDSSDKLITLNSKLIAQKMISNSVKGLNIHIPRIAIKIIKHVLKMRVKAKYQKHFEKYFDRKFIFDKRNLS